MSGGRWPAASGWRSVRWRKTGRGFFSFIRPTIWRASAICRRLPCARIRRCSLPHVSRMTVCTGSLPIACPMAGGYCCKTVFSAVRVFCRSNSRRWTGWRLLVIAVSAACFLNLITVLTPRMWWMWRHWVWRRRQCSTGRVRTCCKVCWQRAVRAGPDRRRRCSCRPQVRRWRVPCRSPAMRRGL